MNSAALQLSNAADSLAMGQTPASLEAEGCE